ncbi:MAG: hypothetical protein A2W05_08645 [Candidatus Schekmanbacteria bacterium RBG_16_38_10]|uniref:PIN domain-containing protein n=1 Tax=Candidatus Schekmanbacteria bacterium RBG_16_38_10 TaxID=1817879 RepID=A0A1F7RV49_9BACT|nr:MAG: hypothetical protein A2W05_08645 [Candidatus Schekmanbacteria bacterium RBG_16_38_10]
MEVAGKLIDTNILVYAYDLSEKEKHEVCKSIVKEIWLNGSGIVTLQNLMEFFVVITTKVERPIPIDVAKTIVEDILSSQKWIVIDRDVDTFINAIEIVSKYEVPFWDAVIAACMLENNINEILTENITDFEKIQEINAINPLP